jgi:hypothetical protein
MVTGRTIFGAHILPLRKTAIINGTVSALVPWNIPN